MRKILLPGLLLGALALINSLNAQETGSDLDPITITTSLSPEKTSRTGRNIFVIRGDRFHDLPVHSIDELLRFLPGVEMQSRGPMGAQSDIVLRGGTFQQVLVILDGLRLNDPNTGHFSGYIPIAPAEIDRIEILKGASSAIYGSEAVGGVVHIITKTFAAKRTETSTSVIAQLTGGEYGMISGNAGVFFSNGKTTVGAGILSNNTKGQMQRGTRGFVNAHTASFSLSHYFNDKFEFKMRYAYDDRKFAAQNFYTNFISDTASERVISFWNQLAFVYHGKKNLLSLHAGYKNLEDEYAFSPSGTPNESTSKMIQALLTNEWQAGENSTIVTGAQFISKRILSNDRGRHRVDQAAGFAILNQQFGEKFLASPAVRMEWNERSGWEFIPQINLSYQFKKLQLRASAGKTIRDADFTERFNNFNKIFVTSGRIGNPNLSPEYSISYEAGADFFLGNDWKFSTGFFQRFQDGLIDYVLTPFSEMPRKFNLSPTGTFALARNISKVVTSGIEADIQWIKKTGNEGSVYASLGMILLNSSSSEATPSFYISSHAKFMTNANLVYSINKFRFSLNGLYKVRQPQTPAADIAKVSETYFVMNVKAEADLYKNIMSVFVEADNIFDSNYADLLGAQMPGRWLMGGIRVSLSK